MTSEGRRPLAGDFVGARSDGRPQMATGGGRAPYRPQAGSTLKADEAVQVGACLRAISWERDRTGGLKWQRGAGCIPIARKRAPASSR